MRDFGKASRFFYCSCSSCITVLDFPKTCISFNGPHGLECQRDLWNETGCVVKGRLYPGKKPNAFSSLNLKYVLLSSSSVHND